MNSIFRNIKKEYIFQFIRCTSLSEAIWVLYLAARGMSLIEIGILESIFHLTGMLMEIPTGFIADHFGRKASRVTGRILAFISSLVMLGAHSFLGFAIGFIFSALSFNLESGAGDALVYDSLAQCGREEEYMKIRGRSEICYQAAQMLSLVLGGAIATISYELAYTITAVIHLTALAISLTFEEPSIASGNREISLMKHMGKSLKAVWDNRRVLPYVLHLEVFSVFYTTLYFYFQNYMKSRGFIEYQIGLLLAFTSAVGILISSVAYRIEKRLGEKNTVIVTGIVPVMLFVMLYVTNIEPVALMLLLSGVESFMFVVFGDYINKRLPSEHRATLLSFEAMLFSIMMILFFPIMGGISEQYGFKSAFGVIALVFTITSIITTGFLIKKKKRVESEV